MGANSSCLPSPLPHEAGLSHKDGMDSKLLLQSLSKHPSQFSRVSLLSPLGCTPLHTAAECKQVQVRREAWVVVLLLGRLRFAWIQPGIKGLLIWYAACSFSAAARGRIVCGRGTLA